MKGMNYAGFHPQVFSSPASDEAVDNLVKTGVNWVAVNIFWYQDDKWAVQIGRHDSKTVSDASLRHLIEYLHHLDLKVLLKPMVDARDHTWRGEFRPEDWEKWMASYREMMLHYAGIAGELAVALLCVGCEFPMDRVNQPMWRALIQDIRGAYPGPLTYAANFNKKCGFKKVTFWEDLDYIGIDAYFPVAGSRKNSVKRMQKGWNAGILAIERWYKKTRLRQPILFTELGAASATGGARKPWKFRQKSAPDWEEQANYYESFFRAFEDRDWLQGAFWWWWDNPSTGDYLLDREGRHATSHTPQGKDAEEVIRQYWT